MIFNQIIRLLVIEDEEFDVRRIRNTIRSYSDYIQIRDVISNGRDALDVLEKNPADYDVIITDYQISGGLMGETLIERIKKLNPALQIIVVTKMTSNLSNFNFAANLMKAGAFWYCTKYPGDIEEFIYQPTDFLLSIYNAFQTKLMVEEQLRSTRKLTKTIDNLLSKKLIIGDSPAINELRDQIDKCSKSQVNVVITGASGTGKELVATHIHYLSNRKFENFIAVNCGSIPHDLIESELFGFEKGSFTGASASKPGLFEMANHGTIFLDEITEMPLAAQVKLLRVLQEGELEKIGRKTRIKVDVRIVAASNRHIEDEVKAGRFREDLYYRLNVIQINVPSLSARPTDIPLLIRHFMSVYEREMNMGSPVLAADAMEALKRHPWPGNVRELINVVQRLLFTGEREISADLVAKALRGRKPGTGMPLLTDSAPGISFQDIIPWRDMETEVKRTYFKFVRDQSDSDADAAKKLGLAPPNYHRMAREIGIK